MKQRAMQGGRDSSRQNMISKPLKQLLPHFGKASGHKTGALQERTAFGVMSGSLVLNADKKRVFFHIWRVLSGF